MEQVRVGVIGGSGLYSIEGLTNVETVWPDTPYGKPSDEIVVGDLEKVRVAFLPRHGRGHTISPSELPARANIWALKSLGVTHILSISAVGSLCEELAPRQIVIPDQIIDRTKGVRPASFFGEGIVAHIAFAEPFCPVLSEIVYQAGIQAQAPMHRGGTMVVMEGPQFSTKSESHFYRQIGGDLIGMTALPEAKLAREAEICYCTVAMVTDYDCWHESEESVTVDMVVANMQANVEAAKRIIRGAVKRVAMAERACGCGSALAGALMTARDQMPPDRVEMLRPLIGRYL
ncbi:MAG: S-methyl-5'-thioadenosine phosphorylase [Chloroflexi bacterium]|nr:S-methyl-5'-thioadenosine phosphorylase [Chloroflexota bacterium]